jgi:transcriptional regulator with XRE-family HTH domain
MSNATDNNILQRAGKLIADKRHLLGMKQDEVAKGAGIRQDALSRIENGVKENFDYTTVLKLSEYLQIPWSDFELSGQK